MTRTIRTLIAAPLIVAAVASGALALAAGPASALDNRHGVASCTEGDSKTDAFGNVYKCIGGDWVLWSMPALTARAKSGLVALHP